MHAIPAGATSHGWAAGSTSAVRGASVTSGGTISTAVDGEAAPRSGSATALAHAPSTATAPTSRRILPAPPDRTPPTRVCCIVRPYHKRGAPRRRHALAASQRSRIRTAPVVRDRRPSRRCRSRSLLPATLRVCRVVLGSLLGVRSPLADDVRHGEGRSDVWPRHGQSWPRWSTSLVAGVSMPTTSCSKTSPTRHASHRPRTQIVPRASPRPIAAISIASRPTTDNEDPGIVRRSASSTWTPRGGASMTSLAVRQQRIVLP